MSEQANSDGWYLLRDNKQHGPYPFSVLIEGANKGHLKENDRVWRQGWPAWQNARTVPGLFTPPSATAGTNGSIERPDATRRNYFVRHWRGDLSLAVSFWLNGVLANLVIGAAALAGVIYLENNPKAVNLTIAAIAGLFVVAWVLLSIWQLVGIWRSASQHALRGGRAFWAGAVKVVVVLAVLRAAIDLKDLLVFAVGAVP